MGKRPITMGSLLGKINMGGIRWFDTRNWGKKIFQRTKGHKTSEFNSKFESERYFRYVTLKILTCKSCNCVWIVTISLFHSFISQYHVFHFTIENIFFTGAVYYLLVPCSWIMLINLITVQTCPGKLNEYPCCKRKKERSVY